MQKWIDSLIMNKNKSKKGFKTMFKNINLKRLNLEELRILLTSIDDYVATNSDKGSISDDVENSLREFGDKICEVIQEKEL